VPIFPCGRRGDLAGRLATTLNKSLKRAARTRLVDERPEGLQSWPGFCLPSHLRGQGVRISDASASDRGGRRS
jgi:hypothetical protein